MNDWWWVSTVAFGISLGTPLVFGTVGEIITERAGILNLGVQGTMLVGAVAGFWATFNTGSLFLGVIAAVLAGQHSRSSMRSCRSRFASARSCPGSP